MREPSFSFHEFRKWMAQQKPEPPKSALIGTMIESKIGIKKLVEYIDGNNKKILSQEFYKFGGIIVGEDKDDLLVEVDSGTFKIPKFFCRKTK